MCVCICVCVCGQDEEEAAPAAPTNSTVLFPIGSAYPSTKRITFKTVEVRFPRIQ